MRSGFTKSVVFAAVAGLSAVAWPLAAGPVLGRPLALAMFAFAAAIGYLATISSRWSQRLVVLAVGGGISVILLLVLPSARSMIVAAALLLGLGRSVFLHPNRPARAVALEVVLVGGGLALGRVLLGASVLDVGLAVWGFFLVQSLFFLVGREQAGVQTTIEGDPFERARDEAVAILEDPA